MKNPRSSSPANSVAWYREPWPWLLIAGPLLVVVACMVTTVIAIRSDDGVVAGDYYKRGLLVNQRLPRTGAVTPHYAAMVALGNAGEIEVHPVAGDPQGDFLRVLLHHPASGTRETISLRRNGEGGFAGTISRTQPGRWIVAVESVDWALPTSVIERGATVRVAVSEAIR
jgi:hypothetical protein